MLLFWGKYLIFHLVYDLPLKQKENNFILAFKAHL